MADNLSVSITADTTALRSQLTLAQSDLKQFGAEARKLAADMRASVGGTSAQKLELDKLSAGYEKTRAQIQQLSAALRGHKSDTEGAGNAVGQLARQLEQTVSPITGTIGGLRQMAEVVGIAFAVEKAVAWTRELSEMGEKTVNMAAAVGMSVEKYSELSRILELASGDADLSSRAFAILGQHIQEALTNDTSKARAGFDAMGISEKQLREGLRDEAGFLDILRQKFSSYDSDLARTTLFRGTFGRSFQTLVPILKLTNEEFAKLRGSARGSGSILDDETGRKLEETAQKFHLIGQAVEGLKLKLYEDLRDPIESALDLATRLVVTLSDAGSGAIKVPANVDSRIRDRELRRAFGPPNAAGNYIDPATGQTIQGPLGPGSPPAGTPVPHATETDKQFTAQFPNRMALPGVAGMPQSLGEISGDLRAPIMRDYPAEKKTLDDKLKTIDSEKTARLAELNFEIQAAGEDRDKIAVIERQKVDVSREALQQREGLISQAEPRIRKDYDKTTAQFIDLQRQELASSQKTAAERRAITEQDAAKQVQLNDITLRTRKFELDQEVAHHSLTVQQALAQERLLTDQLEGENLKRLIDLRDSLSAYPKEYAKVDLQIKEQRLKLRQDLAKIDAEQLNTAKRTYDSIRNEVAGTVSRGIVGIASGQTTGAQAAAQFAQSIATKALDAILGKLFDTLFQKAITDLVVQLGLTTVTETTQIGALAANTAAVTANTAALATSVGASATNTGATALSAAGSAGGLLGGLKTIAGFFFEHGGIVPSAEAGWHVPIGPGGVPAILHGGEMVLPRPIADAVLDGAEKHGGGGEIHHHYYTQNFTTFSPKDAVDAVNRAMRLGGGRLRAA